MNQFMKDGGIIILHPLKPFGCRHADAIFTRGIIGVGHAMLDDGGLWHIGHNVHRLGDAVYLRWHRSDFQSVALAGIENMVIPKQWNFLLLLRFLVLNLQLLPKDDGTCLLTLAHASAKL